MPTVGERVRGRLRIADPAEFARSLLGWSIPFALLVVLAFNGGGYDVVPRGQVAIVVFWALLLAAICLPVPVRRIGIPAALALGLLVLFTAWTGLSASWSDSTARSLGELGRLAAYVGILVLAIWLAATVPVRSILNGVAAAVVVVTGAAVLSRLHPAWFPTPEGPRLLAATARRLSYPLNYWNALAAFAAMGVPLLLQVASRGRTAVGRGAAAAGMTVAGLCVYLTASRGGTALVVVAVALTLLLAPGRVARAVPALLAGAGAAILIAAVHSRSELELGHTTAVAHDQGDAVLKLAIVVVLAVWIAHAVLSTVFQRWSWWGGLRVDRRPATLVGVAVLIVVLGAAVAAGAPGKVRDDWNTFKQPGALELGKPNPLFTRLQSTSGNGRYQLWQGAVDAERAHPWRGIGAGTYEFWWLKRPGHLPLFVRNAHSLYAESLGELGIPGLILIAAAMLSVVGAGLWRVVRRTGGNHGVDAAAVAACATFALGAGFDWFWQVAVLPVAFFLLAGIALRVRRRGEPHPRMGLGMRAVVVAIALVGALAVAIPLLGASSLRASQAAAADGRLADALALARGSLRVQPYSAPAHLQQALVLEQLGDVRGAARATRTAIAEEPDNWQTWLTLSRLSAEQGRLKASIAAFRRARALNPRSPIFNRRR
jgi:hypothetical protein